MTLKEEKDYTIQTASLGAEIALKRLGLIKDEISQREAFRLAGEAKVRSWENEGLLVGLKGEKKNSKKTYSRIELTTLMRIALKRRLK